jgi:hypothetical protein
MRRHRARGTSPANDILATSSGHVVHPPPPYDLRGRGPFYDGGSPLATSLALAPLAIPSPIIYGQLRTVRRNARPCRPTGRRHRPHASSPPDEVLPSHPHSTVEGLSTPTNPPTQLARATTRSGMLSLAPPLIASSTPSLLPFTFGSEVCLSLEGVVAHPFCAGGLTPPPRKRTRREHRPLRVCRSHGPRAPDPQEHLLCGR